MALIAFGGTPNLNERRSFAELKGGTHVPGYRGYIPQRKYRIGKTYGTHTFEVVEQEVVHRKPCDPCVPQPPVSKLKHDLPETQGDNRLTRNMVPGYTGYIPGKTFKFGNTYKEDCDVCIDKFLSAKENKEVQIRDLQHSLKTQAKHQAITVEPNIKNKMDKFHNSHPQPPILLEDRRKFLEPPMPGYRGFIPRIYSTEQGLGCRYNQMTKNGLATFKQENDMHHHVNQTAVSVDRGSMIPMPSYARRLYPQGGMIPKYTGYIPQRRFHFGNTYGDTSRSLDICNHNKDCYGDHANSTRLTY